MRSDFDLLTKMRNFEKTHGLRAFSLEFEIILELFYSGPVSSGELKKKINASQASFSLISRTLRDSGVLISSSGKIDKRMVIYSLSEEMKELISRSVITNSNNYTKAAID